MAEKAEIKLPSGAILKIALPPFDVSKALMQAVTEEAKGMKLNAESDLAQIYKDVFCFGVSSRSIEAALWECMKKCTYNAGAADMKITKETFEPENARQDYLTVCVEVAKANIGPFVKSLYAEYAVALKKILSSPA